MMNEAAIDTEEPVDNFGISKQRTHIHNTSCSLSKWLSRLGLLLSMHSICLTIAE